MRSSVSSGLKDSTQRRELRVRVYTIVGVQIVATALLVIRWAPDPAIQHIILDNPVLSEVIFVAIFIAYWSLICCKAYRHAYPSNAVIAGFFTIGSGLVTSLITAKYRGSSVVMAFGICVVCIVAVTYWAATTVADVTGRCYLLIIAAVICATTGILLKFFPSMNLRYASAGVGALAFMMFLAAEIQLVNGGKTVQLETDEHLLGALLVYTSAIEAFKHFIVLFAEKERG